MKSWMLMCLTVGLLFGAANAPDGAEADDQAIQGTWKVVSAEDSGQKPPDEDIKDLKWVIAKDRITYKFGDTTTEWSYKLDATKKPKWIDLTTEGDRTVPGIYELEGDNLKICYPEGKKKERATAFESKPDSANDILIILERENP